MEKHENKSKLMNKWEKKEEEMKEKKHKQGKGHEGEERQNKRIIFESYNSNMARSSQDLVKFWQKL